jgi:hypothetical protein
VGFAHVSVFYLIRSSKMDVVPKSYRFS